MSALASSPPSPSLRCRLTTAVSVYAPSSSLCFPKLRFGQVCPGSITARPANRLVFVVSASSSSSSSSFDEIYARDKARSNQHKSSVLLNLIHEIEPLDVSLIQKDVPAETVDAMKRTISSMLGLLPSDQFHVSVEALWEPLSKLLASSMMTGYTLRNAEYRLSLEKKFDGNDMNEASFESDLLENTKVNSSEILLKGNNTPGGIPENGDNLSPPKITDNNNVDLLGLGEMSPDVQGYIQYLQSQLSSVKEELCTLKRKNSMLEMQRLAGEEKNDLLDYLRSLHPEKVAELSEPTNPGIQEAVSSVVHGLLATLSPKIYSKAPPPENAPNAPVIDGEDDCTELLENTYLQFQPLISVSRDYLARLLFWCMLLGHHLRGLEYRLELIEILALPTNKEIISPQAHSDQVA